MRFAVSRFCDKNSYWQGWIRASVWLGKVRRPGSGLQWRMSRFSILKCQHCLLNPRKTVWDLWSSRSGIPHLARSSECARVLHSW